MKIKNLSKCFTGLLFLCFIGASQGAVAQTTSNDNPGEQKVYGAVEEMPTFPGGDQALHQWIDAHLEYPESAADEGISGRVMVRFVVKSDGSIGEVEVMRGKHPDLDKEAVSVVKALPKFIPGRQNGEAVAVWYTLPINFRLPK